MRAWLSREEETLVLDSVLASPRDAPGVARPYPEDMRALHGANAHLDECTNLVADPTSKHETQTTSATDHPTLHAADR